MSHSLIFISLFFGILCSNILGAESRQAHVANQLIVKYQKSPKQSFKNGIKTYLGAKTVKKTDSGFEVLKIAPNRSLDEALFLMKQDPSVIFAEPDYLFFTTDTFPNDSQLSSLWGLHNSGQDGGLMDVDINAPALWDLSTGNNDVVLGLIDTGVNYNHPDLSANLWQNPGEIAGNGIDDDNNGYIDDIYGINAILDSPDPMDDNGHGSHVAGIMAAVGNNNLGVCGLMQNARVASCKFLNENGSGATSDAIQCLDYFRDLKLRENLPQNILLTNNSWASNAFSESLKDAIALQDDAGILFVAASDNLSLDNDIFPTYPANFHLSNIISVAAVDRLGQLASFSNWGKHSVHVAAPGVEILSTHLNSSYLSLDGTSMATPFASGLLGLISDLNPGFSHYQKKNLLLSSGKPLLALADKTMGESLIRGHDIDGKGAATCLNSTVFKSTWPRNNIISTPINSDVMLEVLNINCSEPQGNFTGTISPGDSELSFLDDGQNDDLKAEDGLYSATFNQPLANSYRVDLNGNGEVFIENYDKALWQSYRLVAQPDFSYVNFLGTKIEMIDDDIKAIVAPFKIPWANDPLGLSHIYIGSNGTISLTNNKLLDWENSSLPFLGFDSAISLLWTDLNPKDAGPLEGIFYEVLGVEPERTLVIEWRQVKHYDAPGKVSFQVVFNENSPSIALNYLDVDFDSETYDGGANATKGAQVADMAFNYNELISDNTSFHLELNQTPTAQAGDDKSLKINQATILDGSSSLDPEDGPLTYLWTQISGPGQNLSNTDQAQATIIGQAAGTAVFELTVTDDGGAYHSDTISITIPQSSKGSGGGGGGGGKGGSKNNNGPIRKPPPSNNFPPVNAPVDSPSFPTDADLAPKPIVLPVNDENLSEAEKDNEQAISNSLGCSTLTQPSGLFMLLLMLGLRHFYRNNKRSFRA